MKRVLAKPMKTAKKNASRAWRAPWLSSLLSLLAGAAAALAHPPFGVLPGLLGYALILRLADGAEPSRPLASAFWRGWLAGLAYFGVGVWWVSQAFLVDPAQAWMAPAGPVLLAAGLALFWGLAALVYRRSAPSGPLRVLSFAAVFSLAEWLRGHVLTGFPWNLPGETWAAGSYPSQAAAWIGAYGLTFVTLAISACAAVAFEGPRGRIAGLAGLAGLAALYGFGAWRLHQPPPSSGRPLSVRIVQADVPQVVKYDPAVFADIVEKHLALTARPAAKPADLVVWPEGAVPAAANDYLAPGTWTREAIARTLKPGQTLLVGAYRVAGTSEKPIYYNTMLALRRDADLSVVGVYDKHRLVPFGEYLPMERLAAAVGFKKLVAVGDSFTPGPKPRPLDVPGVGVIQPLICYESLYPGFVQAGGTARRARAIFNLSNDAWFGQTSGPLQHLNLASYRAIEAGLPLIRSTPTGVSAVIDAHGRQMAGESLGAGRMGVIDAAVPPALPATPYSRFGDLPFWLMTLAGLLTLKARRAGSALKTLTS